MAWPIPPARYGRWPLLDSFGLCSDSPHLGRELPLSPAGDRDVNRLSRPPARNAGKEQQARSSKKRSRLDFNGLGPTGPLRNGFRAMEAPHPQCGCLEVLQAASSASTAAKSRPDGGLELDGSVRPSRWPRLNCAASMMKSVWMWGQPSLPPEVRLEATAETTEIEIPPAGLVGIRVSSGGGTAAMGGRRRGAGFSMGSPCAPGRERPAAAGAAPAPPRSVLNSAGLGFAARQSDQD